MKDKRDNGGPAFQHTCKETHGNWTNDVNHPGMSLRDYFAAKALQGLLADPGAKIGDNKEYAESAYWYADAMLQARKS